MSSCYFYLKRTSSSWWAVANKLAISPVKVWTRNFQKSSMMANSKWDYVKKFEITDTFLPNCWAVARIDGRGFHKLAKKHNWARPNDLRGISLMNHAAKIVMQEFNDIILSYGQSDEYSFIFRREAEIFERRESKIITTLVSKFSAAFVFHWADYFPDEKLQYPPSFDGRIILYPTDQNLRDYLCWRQADCHINNLYNTTFWALVLKGNLSNSDAQKKLSGTLSGDKNEILFSQFEINYNNEPEIFKKGTTFLQKARPCKIPRNAHLKTKDIDMMDSLSLKTGEGKDLRQDNILELQCDIIGNQFWEDYPHILNPLKNNKS